MKKAGWTLGIIFTLVALIVFWKLSHSGPIAAAQLLPNNTIALVEAPNFPAAMAHWSSSELCKLIFEPEMQAFLRRPLDRFYQKSGFLNTKLTPKMTKELFIKVKPGRFFAALEPSQQEREANWILGCQFFGDKTAMEEALLKITQSFDLTLGAGHDLFLKPEEHHGDVIKKRTYPFLSLYIAMHGNWYFASNDLATLEKTLDLAAGRTSRKEALLSSSSYQKNHKNLFPESDLFCYVTHYSALGKLSSIFSLLQEDELIKLANASGASFRFIKEGMEERVFLSGDFKIDETIAHRGIRFTQPTTLGFIERLTDWKQIVEQIKNNPGFSPNLTSFLATSELDLLSLASLLKSEMTLAINWMQENTLPTILLAAPEADSEKMANWLDQAAPQLGSSVEASTQSDLLMVSMSKVAPSLQPAFASANGSFFISTDPLIIKQEVSHKATTPTLETAPYFSKNAALYHQANEAFFYFSSKEIFERVYALGRPSLLAGSTFFPQAKAFIDFSRLPSPPTIAKHLTPTMIAQSHTKDGFLIQSRGPLSATPLFLIGKIFYQTAFLKQSAASVREAHEQDNQNAPAEEEPSS